MNRSGNIDNERIADLIESRSPAGRNEMVQGWQKLLKDILIKVAPFMIPGHLVTFQKLEDREIAFFEGIHRKIKIPENGTSIYIPPAYGIR